MSFQPGWVLGQSFLGQDTFLTSPRTGAVQRQTYQAFLEHGDGDKWVGYVREVDQRFQFNAGGHLQALHVLGDMICTWAHGNQLSHLPEPLADRVPKDAMPRNVAVMAETDVVYDPVAR